MQARMKNPAYVLPDGMKGIGTLFKAIDSGGLPHELVDGLEAMPGAGC